MIPIINKIGINVSCFGNHEFDHGINQLVNLLKKIDPIFPIISTNLNINEENFKKLTFIKKYLIKNVNGIKVGYLGLYEKEWLDSCPSFRNINYEYNNFIDL